VYSQRGKRIFSSDNQIIGEEYNANGLIFIDYWAASNNPFHLYNKYTQAVKKASTKKDVILGLEDFLKTIYYVNSSSMDKSFEIVFTGKCKITNKIDTLKMGFNIYKLTNSSGKQLLTNEQIKKICNKFSTLEISHIKRLYPGYYYYIKNWGYDFYRHSVRYR